MANEEGSDPSHAGAGARAIDIAPTVEERIRHIAGLMETLTFQRGKTCRVLAAQWGLAVSTVEGNAAEAHRQVVRDSDKDEVARDITVAARRLIRSAVLSKDNRGFAAVGNLLADIVGAKAPVRSVADVNLGPASPSEAARLVREAFGSQAAQAIAADVIPVADADGKPA